MLLKPFLQHNLGMRLLRIIIFAIAIVRTTSAAPLAKPALLFDVAQPQGFGIIEHLDLDAFERIADALEPFRQKFEVYLVFSPLTAKTSNLEELLKKAASRKFPIILDVLSSDAIGGNIRIEANPDSDPSHIREISLDRLRALKANKEIGPFIAGVRIHELLAFDYTVKRCRQPPPAPPVDWCARFDRNIADTNIFDADTVKGFLDFARDNKMLVFWSDWKWDPATSDQQAKLRSIIESGDYKNILIVAYANNLPNLDPAYKEKDWHKWLLAYGPLVGSQIRGLGFSDQSWTCGLQRGCPTDVVNGWALRALRAGSVAIEFEPIYYLFDLPQTDDSGYPLSAPWRARGSARGTLKMLATALGVPHPPLNARLMAAPRKVGLAPFVGGADSGNEAPDATCVSIVVDQSKSTVGNNVRLSATFENTGTADWPSGVRLVRYGSATLAVDKASHPVAALAPGERTTLSFDANASQAAGRTFAAVVLEDQKGSAFGQPCALVINIKHSGGL